MSYPTEFKYTKDHEWARVEGTTVTVGITEHAQSALGDIVFVELPQPGRALRKGETFGVVESIKAVSDLYSPIDGTILEVNTSLAQDPSLINRSPHSDAWMVRMECPAIASADLMSASQYSEYVKSLQ